MDIEDDIKRLWRYLNIQDNTTLIIKVYDLDRKADVAVVVTRANGTFNIEIADTIPELDNNMDFYLIEQRDSNGKYIIPPVERIIQDEKDDY